MTAPLDLFEVMRRYAAGRAHDDVPALVAEVERLNKALDDIDREWVALVEKHDAKAMALAAKESEVYRLSAENARLRAVRDAAVEMRDWFTDDTDMDSVVRFDAALRAAEGGG